MISTTNPLYRQVWCVSAMIGVEQYHFRFTLDSYKETLRLVAKCAADPELNFTWYAAAQVTRRICDVACAAQQVVAKTVAASELSGQQLNGGQQLGGITENGGRWHDEQ
jgi:hypothetical protein